MSSSLMVSLAGKLKQDIRERNLKPGDSYLTASEAATLLGVSTHRANRALQLLAVQGCLSRSRGAAPVVADTIWQEGVQPKLSKVYVLSVRTDSTAEGFYADGHVLGIQRALPDAHIQWNYFPERDEGKFTAQLVSEARRNHESAGFVLSRSSIDAQAVISESGLPAVISGTPFAGIRNVSSMDNDYEQMADLHSTYFRQQGCDRVLLVMHNRMYGGGFVFLDAMNRRVAECGYSPHQVAIRFLPVHDMPIAATIAEETARSRRLGVFVWGMPLAQRVAAGMTAQGLTPGRDVVVTYSGYYSAGPLEPLKLPHDQSVLDPQQQGEQVAAMLLAHASGKLKQPQHVKIGTRLVCPE